MHLGAAKTTKPIVVALWRAFYTEDKRFGLSTLRVFSRSPTPISKTSGFRGPFDHIWGDQDPHFRPISGVPGARAGLTNTHLLSFETTTTRLQVRIVRHLFWTASLLAIEKVTSLLGAPLFVCQTTTTGPKLR